MLKIRLRRMGKRHRPFYRVVVSESRSVPQAPAVEEIGHYDPMAKPPSLKIDVERIQHWVDQGALMSPTVKKLVKEVRTGRAAAAEAEAEASAEKAAKAAKADKAAEKKAAAEAEEAKASEKKADDAAETEKKAAAAKTDDAAEKDTAEGDSAEKAEAKDDEES